jgi:penicillin-binding protein 1A
MRKPVEWYIAVQLERHYTKEEIISMYFNYFDFLYNGVGIKNAARTYFDKAPIDLSLEECAMLVGMCKNPSLFNPVRNPERALERRNVVLAQMRKARYLSQAEMEAAQARPVDVCKFHVTTHVEGIAPYFREYLRRIMMAKEPNLHQ